MGTAAVDEVGDARPAQRADGRVDRESPRPARGLGVPVELVPLAGLGIDQVARLRAHGRPVYARMRAEGEPRIVGNIQPLVGVCGPGVGELDAPDEMA